MRSPRRSFELLSAAVLLITGFVLPNHAFCESLFTVDTVTDSLYVIDSATGAIVDRVGPLGINIEYCHDLTTTPVGSLFALFTVVNSTVPRFGQISRTTGAVLYQIPIAYPYAEALADDPITGELFITFGNGPGTASNHLGVVDTELATITDLGPLATRADGEDDVDALRFTGSGQLYAMDARCCGRGSDLYLMNGLAGTYIGSTPNSLSDLNAVEFLSSGTLVALDTTDDVLVTISLADGSVTGAVFLPRINFAGIARVESGPVNTVPATWGRVKATFR